MSCKQQDMCFLCGCGKTETTEETVQEVLEVEPVVEETESLPETDTETADETVEQPIIEEAVEEPVPEEPKTEMVDFETWAKQEGNDEVCLVVWNEELGIQEILQSYQECEAFYIIQAGDRFAIPYNESITVIRINGEDDSFYNDKYLEVSLIKGEVNQVTILFDNVNGESQNINYLFN